MVNLKDNIWIEGFGGSEQVSYNAFIRMAELAEALVWHGKTSDIPEEVAKECVRDIVLSTGVFYINYRKMEALKLQAGVRRFYHNEIVWEPMLKTAKESIQSACNQEYCIIFKK